MKVILLSIVFLFVSTVTKAQDLPIVDDKIVYEYIFEFSGKSKDEIYKLSKKFYVDAFKNSNYVLKQDDKEYGQLIGKGFREFVYIKGGSIIGTKYPFHFTIQIDVKEGKSKIKIYDIYAEYNTGQYGSFTRLLEELNIEKSKGIQKSEKKLRNYKEWSNSINDCFLEIIAMYKIDVQKPIDDNW